MVQNRNKIIDLFIGNISNAIIHEILEKAIDVDEIISRYNKESKVSFEVAKKYREKINPVDKILPSEDIAKIRNKVINNVKNELNIRILKGYKNLNVTLVEETVDKFLKEMKIK
ncbi:MAG: hypothetical protein AABX29_04760 [Nanoarchaeota archaeon]